MHKALSLILLPLSLLVLPGCVTIEKISGSTLIQQSGRLNAGASYSIVEPVYGHSVSRIEHQAYTTRVKPVFVKTGRDAYGQTHEYMNRAIREELAQYRMHENREDYTVIVQYSMSYNTLDLYGETKTQVMVNLRVYNSQNKETYYYRSGSFIINERLDMRGSIAIVDDLLSEFQPQL